MHPIECDTFSFSALTLLVGRQEGVRPACKKLGVGLLMVMISLELCMRLDSAWAEQVCGTCNDWLLSDVT